jgi:Ca2+-binding RTX toxin-like protein
MSDQNGTSGDDLLVGNDDADTLHGAGGNDRLLGRAGADSLFGDDGNDILDGGAGADLLDGGPGDDIFFVDDAGDVIHEAAGGGFDLVYTSVTYRLLDLPLTTSQIERLAASDPGATSPLSLSGNELDNEIWGNAGANSLYGYSGHDILHGGAGDDLYLMTYEVNTPDQVIEHAGGGYDTVETQFSYALADNVERLSYWGDGPATLIGNGLDNEVIATNQFFRSTLIIDGGGGADVMQGSRGADIFFVDDAGDVILVTTGDSSFPSLADTVFSTVDFTLGTNQWRVIATAPGALTGLQLTGNGLSNEITGNAGDNVLDGGADADILVGYGGADTFCFTGPLGGGNVDQFVTFEAGTDRIALGASTFAGLQLGALDPAAFATGPLAMQADDRILYDPATGYLFFDADGSGSAAAQQFAILHEGLSLSASDFFVI